MDGCRIDENRVEVSDDHYRVGKCLDEIAKQFAAVVFDDPSDVSLAPRNGFRRGVGKFGV